MSSRFFEKIEEVFPEININYLRNREDNILVTDVVNDSEAEYKLCLQCKEKERLIEELEKRLIDKDQLIESLKEQIRIYKTGVIE